ncbi:MAG: hypothetical protein KDK04_00325 [Candidatus Competibacteraceae bacterium]|nr:hypothetical protein [Candidatus Competibacteraceae bacterium]
MQNQLLLLGVILGFAQKSPHRLARTVVQIGVVGWTTVRCPILCNLLLLGIVGALSASINATVSLAVLVLLATQLSWLGGNRMAVCRIYRLLHSLPPLFDEDVFKASLVEATERELGTQVQVIQGRLTTARLTPALRRELRAQLHMLYTTLAGRRAARQALSRSEPLGKPVA